MLEGALVIPELPELPELPDLPELPVDLELVSSIRSDLAVSLALAAAKIADDLATYRKGGLIDYSVQTARAVLGELVALVILLEEPPLPAFDPLAELQFETVEVRP